VQKVQHAMRFRFPFVPNQIETLFPFRRDNRRPTWDVPDARIDPRGAIRLFGDKQNGETFGGVSGQANSGAAPFGAFPFRRDNRGADGTWDAEDATDDNIKGTSVDPHDPVWPRWIQTPPPDGVGEFVSGDPFFDIDEITQRATFYPAGTPLVDRNVDGNPASRQRVRDIPAGNPWRRRLLVGHGDEVSYDSASRELLHQADPSVWRPTRLAQRPDLVRVQNGRGAPRVLVPRVLDLPAPVATEENVVGTSVDRNNPVWPRWTKAPAPGESGDFISGEPFYDIDEATGKITLYRPGTPLRDTNIDGNPGSRWRGSDSLHGNPWRRRLKTWRAS